MMDEKDESDFQRVKKAVETLSEYFDTVQIFASRFDPEGNKTFHVSNGYGNIFARQGQVQEWVNKPMEDANEDNGE